MKGGILGAGGIHRPLKGPVSPIRRSEVSEDINRPSAKVFCDCRDRRATFLRGHFEQPPPMAAKSERPISVELFDDSY